MDKNTSSDLTRLRTRLVLPVDVNMVPAQDLSDEVKKGIPYSENDIVITRLGVRSTSKVIDEKLSLLMEEFRNPVSITDAVVKFTSGDREEAEAVLDEFLPIALDLIGASFLIFEDELNETVKVKTLDQGEVFRQFTILKCIQQLEKESVYQARGDDEEYYALKISEKTPPIGKHRRRTQVCNEILVLNGLQESQCDCVATISDSGEEDHLHWIATRWIQGSAINIVSSELRKMGDIEGLQKLAVSVADSYAKLHMSGVLHGDIHPGNIQVTSSEEVVLIDFGFGQRLSQPLRPSGAGVAFYTEPEVAKAYVDGEVPPASSELGEQFSIAALIFEILSGDMYTEFNLEQSAMYQQISNANPEELKLPGGARWRSMEDCLKRALSVDKKMRFADMSEFARCLRSCDASSVAEQSNSYVRQIKTTRDRFSQFVHNSLDEIPADADKFISNLAVGPTCSLSGGAIGVSYTLYRIACMRGSPELHGLAEQWISCAKRHQFTENAYHDVENSKEFSVVDPCSIHHGAAGIPFVQCLLAASVSDAYRAERFAEMLLELAPIQSTGWDTTLGKLSVVLACCEILATTTDMLPEDSLLVAQTDLILQSVWSELHESVILSARGNIGFSHGTIGLIYTSLIFAQFSDVKETYPLYETATKFLNQLRPVGRGIGFPWRAENGSEQGMMSGWCNGSAGAVFLLATLYEYDSNPVWLQKAEQFGWHVWESDGGIYDLCCGSAGRIFSLLRLYQATGNNHWIKRAELIGVNAIARVNSYDSYPHWSLFKGRLGLVLAIESLLTPDDASMPMMGIAV